MLLQEAKLELKKSKRKDYYKILSLSKNCTDSDIKKAYKREALKHHPGIIKGSKNTVISPEVSRAPNFRIASFLSDRHSGATDQVKKDEEMLFKEVLRLGLNHKDTVPPVTK